jgi:hypothetical protein
MRRLSFETIMSFAVAGVSWSSCQTTDSRTVSPVAVAGLPLKIGHFASLNPDCTSMGEVVARITKNADHGVVTIQPGQGYTNYPETNPRNHCNYKPTSGVNVIYVSNSGYIGPDSVGLDFFYPNGSELQFAVNVKVK